MFWFYLGYTIVLSISLCIGGFLAVYSWQKRSQPAAMAFCALTLSTNLAILGNLAMLLSPNPEVALFWGKVRFTGIILIPIFYLMFVLEYVDHEKWVKVRRWWFLLIIPAISLVLLWLVDKGIYREWRVERYEFVYIESAKYKGWFWINILFTYCILITGLVMLFRQVVRSVPPYRWQALILFVGGMAGVLTSLLTLSSVLPENTPGLTPIGFTIRNIIFAWGFFAFKLLDIVPIAYAAIFNSMKEGVIMLDKQDRIVNMNPAALQLINQTLPQVMGKPTEQVFASYPEMVRRYQDIFEAREELKFGTNENARYVEMQIAPLYRRTQQLAGRIVTLRDITAQKQAEHEREQLIEVLDAYAHTVAHDLKNPLSVIMGYSDLLQGELPIAATPKAQGMLNRIIETGKKANEIIDNLLLFASVREIDLVPIEVIEPQPLLDSVLARLAERIQQANAQISIAQPLPSVIGYGVWIEEVWANLISNAIKYGGSPPMIQVSADQRDGMVRFSVKDNGEGLSPEEQSRLFQHVTRLEKHTNIEGHGFGLTIIQRIVERLGGKVGVESAPGQGSTFYFSLKGGSYLSDNASVASPTPAAYTDQGVS